MRGSPQDAVFAGRLAVLDAARLRDSRGTGKKRQPAGARTGAGTKYKLEELHGCLFLTGEALLFGPDFSCWATGSAPLRATSG
jgi:hypothetical protein